MGLLDLFSRKSHTAPDGPTTGTIRQMCELLRPGFGGGYSDRNSTGKYRSWVYAASTLNARSVADSYLKLYSNVQPKTAKHRNITSKALEDIRKMQLKAHAGTVEITDHPVIELLHNPNPRDTLYDILYRTDLFLELTGDAYWHITKDANGIPTEINVLYSQFIDIQHDGTNRIIRYGYGIPQGGEYQYSFLPEEIIHFKFFDPDDLFHGISPLQAAARSYGLIESMSTYEEALNRNMGIPSGMLKYTNQAIKPDDRKIIETKWQQKFASVGRAGKLLVTDQDMDYKELGVTPRNMQFLDGRKWSREEILACFGVNPALLLTEATNYSNMITARVNYHEDTLKPRHRLISQTITKRLLYPHGINGKDLFAVITRDAPEDKEMQLERAKLLASTGSVTRNELREAFNYDPLDGNAGNELTGVSQNEV